MSQALRIIIDAGHGGSERAGNSSAYGARGSRGVVEKDVTLDIAKHVVARLGGAAKLTRTGDRNLTIGARAARGQRSDVFVSIHANYGAPELSGPEVYVHPEAGHPSRALARRIAHALDRQAGRYGGGDDERRAAMAVLNPSAIGQTAACLVEVDYLSNLRGEQRLGDPGERAAIGAAIASAIQEHLANGRAIGRPYGEQLELRPGTTVDSGTLTLQPGIPGHAPLLLSSAHNGGTLALEGTIAWNAGARPRAITARFTELASQGIAGTDHAVRLPADLDAAIPLTGAGGETLRWQVPANPGPARFELMLDSTDPETRVRADWRAVVSPPSLVPPSPIAQGLEDNIRWDVLEQRLRYGCVVDLDVRSNDSREPMSHAYPIDAAGKVKLPMVGLVDALDVSLQTLAQRVQSLLAPDYYRSPTVNATLKHRIVSYGANVTAPRLHVRLLDSGGAIQNDSGWYPVRADGTLNLPYVGSVMARGRRLDEVEAEVQAGYRRDYLINAIVHVTPFELDAS